MHPIALVTRTLASDARTSLIGSVTNLWLDGEPTDSEIVNYFIDNSRTGRQLDVHAAPGSVAGVVKLLAQLASGSVPFEDVTRQPYDYYKRNAKQESKQLRFAGLGVNIYCKYPTVLETMHNGDITANMKYVHQGVLTGLLPTAIDDARDGKLVWLGTCSSGRKQEIALKMRNCRGEGHQLRSMSPAIKPLVPGFYGVAVEPPWEVEKLDKVLTGWRTYRVCPSTGILMGDTGVYWKSEKFDSVCKYGGADEQPSSAKHLDEHECGVYVQWRPRVNNYNYHNGGWQVYAQCVAWGNVAMYTEGCRAEKVRLEKLYVVDTRVAGDSEAMELLRRVYQVPVVGWPTGGNFGFSELFREPTMEEFLGVDSLFDDRGR